MQVSFNLLHQVGPITFAVFINLLDPVTFGTCFFPIVLGDTSSFAIDLFLFSTVVVQTVFLVMSSFDCGLGTSMAENIPFIHTIALNVFTAMGGGKGEYSVQEMMPTIMASLSISTLLNGSLFFLVGYFKQGYILHYFPRHVILGITLGFGIFLLQTSFQVTTGLPVAFGMVFVKEVWEMGIDNWMQLLIVCLVEGFLCLLPLLQIRDSIGQLTMFAIPVMFYVVLWISGVSFPEARDANWLFPLAPESRWSDMWVYYTVSGVHWDIVAAQTPTILGLAAFTLFLVPIRIPTLASITGDDVDFDAELKAQGVGNLVSGMFGSVHNYLSYANSVFFYNMEGEGKFSQSMIALITAALFLAGPQVIDYVPRVIAGVIMLHLGFDLILDAVVSSRASLDKFEYISIIAVGSIVTVFGFVPGVIAGGVSACATFVVQSSKSSNVRGVFTGEAVRSNTSWPARYRDKLDMGLAKHGIYVIQLQGQIFFGNIQRVIKQVRRIIESNSQQSHNQGSGSLLGDLNGSVSNDLRPVYVVLDCSFVSGLDNNAVEGLLKLQTQLLRGPSESGLNDIVNLSFAGLQPTLLSMFTVHIDEQIKRFGGSYGNGSAEDLKLFDILAESHPLEKLDGEMQDGIYLSEESKLLGNSSAPVRPHSLPLYGTSPSSSPHSDLLSESSCFVNLRRKASEGNRSVSKSPIHHRGSKNKRLHHRSQSADICRETSLKVSSGKLCGGVGSISSNNLFHHDVNTALQSVEENIIEHESNSLVESTLLDSRAFDLSLPQTSANHKQLSVQIPTEPSISDTPSPVPMRSFRSPSRWHLPYDSIGGTAIDLGIDPESTPDFVLVSPLRSMSYAQANNNIFEDPGKTSQLLPLGIGLHSVVNSVMVSPSTSPRKRIASNSNTTFRQNSPLGKEPVSHEIEQKNNSNEAPLYKDTDDDLFCRLSRSPSYAACDADIINLLRSKILDLSSSWTKADIPMLSRLVDHFAKDIRFLRVNEILWNAGDEAVSMALLLSGRLDAIVDNNDSRSTLDTGRSSKPLAEVPIEGAVKTLQIILPGTLVGELGLINRASHSRTIVSTALSRIAVMTLETLQKIEQEDTALLCALQKLALQTAGRRSQQLMLFQAGALGSGWADWAAGIFHHSQLNAKTGHLIQK